MIRLLVPAVAFVLIVVVWLYALLDVAKTDAPLMRVLPKPMWLTLVLLTPPIGAMAWIVFGRPRFSSWLPGGAPLPPPPRAIPPEDQPDWPGRSG